MTAPPRGLAPVRIIGGSVTLRPFTEPEVVDVESTVYDHPDRERDRWGVS